MAMDGSQPLEFLLSLLDQIAKEDPSNVFEYPVDGSVVKGYYDKIKHPMCFYVMREKLRKQEYRTWRSFTRDFELICENAKLFNPPQNRVHKLAINLQRAGRKVLQGNELPGRRCLSVLHPDGPKQAADEEAAEILVTKNEPLYSSQLLLIAETDEQQTAAGDDRQDQQQGHPIADHKPVQPVPEDLTAAHQLWDATSEQLTTADWGLLFRELPDLQLDNVTQQLKQPVVYQPYCSLEPQQQQQPAAQQHRKDANEASPAKSQLLKVTADWLLARQPVTWRCQWLYTRIQELTSVIAALQSQGSTVPISFPAAPGTAAATTPKAAGAGAAAGGAEGLVSSTSAAEAMEGLSLLQVQQGGMLLQQHVAAIQKQGPILQSPFFAAHLAGTHSDPLPPVANRQAAHQHEQQQHVQQQQDQQQTEGQGESSKQPAEDQQQQQQQGSAADMDVDQPAGGATATAKVPEAAAAAPEGSGEVKEQQQQEQQQQEATNSGTAEQDGAAAAAVAASEVISKAATGPADPAAAAAAAHPAAGAAAVGPPDTQECDAALIFSSLELVEHQLVAARLMIARAFGIEVTLAPTGVRLGQYTAARVWGDSNTGLNPAAAAHGPGGQKRSAAAAGLGLARGFSGALDRGPGQGRGLQREGSLAGSMKKRRVERSGAAGVAGSIDADDGVLSPSSSLPARLLDRVVTSIHIPSVREIPKEEQEALSAAATTWRAAVKAHGQRAGLAKPPVEVRRVLEAAAADEGSSSEDTSDEAYAIMHKPLEEDEHIRLCGPTGGGRKRNKNKTKQSGSKQQQQGKSEQQQQLSKQQQQQQQQAAQDQPGSPRPARGKGNAANGASAAAAPPTSVATVPVVSQAAPAAAAAVPPLKASIDSSKLPPAITIPNSLPTSPHKFSRTPAASPVVAAAAAALAAAAAGTATPAAAAGLQSASPAAATAAGGVLQLSQQQVLWLQQHAGQPVMVLTPSVTSPSAAAAVAAAAEKQQPPSVGNKQAAGAAAAAGARSGGAAAGNAAAASSGGAGGSGLHSTRSRELPARLTSTQLASTRANGAVAGSGGSSRGVATRTSSGGIRDKDVDKAAAAAADKPERSKEANAGSGRGSGSGKDKDVAASSGKQQSERSGSVRKTVSPAAAAAPAAVAKDVKEPSKSPAVVSRSPSAAVAGTVAAGTRRASAAAAAAASAAKRRSSNRVKAQEASGKVKARTGK